MTVGINQYAYPAKSWRIPYGQKTRVRGQLRVVRKDKRQKKCGYPKGHKRSRPRFSSLRSDEETKRPRTAHFVRWLPAYGEASSFRRSEAIQLKHLQLQEKQRQKILDCFACLWQARKDGVCFSSLRAKRGNRAPKRSQRRQNAVPTMLFSCFF